MMVEIFKPFDLAPNRNNNDDDDNENLNSWIIILRLIPEIEILRVFISNWRQQTNNIHFVRSKVS